MSLFAAALRLARDEGIDMPDDFDRFGLDPDLATAARVANQCAKDAVDLCFRLQTTDFVESVTPKPKNRQQTRLAPRPLPEAPDWMRKEGANRAAILSASTSALRAALEPVRTSLIGALPGKKQLGAIRAYTIHDAILVFSERLLNGLLWYIGSVSNRQRPILTAVDVEKIEQRWALIAQQMGGKDIVTTANEAVNEVLKLLMDESLGAQRLRHTRSTEVSATGEAECSHSPDFRSIIWFGKSFTFTSNQAACVKILWENYERGTPDVSGATLLEAADIQQDRFDKVFRDNNAWRTVIVSGKRKGTYRLATPSEIAADIKTPSN